jgi:NAD(P)-dependent dehydrogenase (short-subunit alcohol dehydrogenase family)
VSDQKVIVLTGATDGMGRVAAPRLAKAGYFIFAQGRDETRGKAVIKEIEAAGGEGRFMPCNLASLKDVCRFAAEVAKLAPNISVLINNAGIGTGPDDAPREESADGFERRFAVNYLSHYLLTKLFKDKVTDRIINVASAGQEPVDFNDVMLTKMYSGYYAYCRSKLAQIMMTIDLAEEMKSRGVTVNAMHPGAYMNTAMVRHMGHEVVDSVDEGAQHMLDLATHPKFAKVTGRYIAQGLDTAARPQAYDASARKQLRDISDKLIGPFL